MTDKEQAQEAWKSRIAVRSDRYARLPPSNERERNLSNCAGNLIAGFILDDYKAALKAEIEKRMSLEIGPWKYCYEEVLSLMDTTTPL